MCNTSIFITAFISKNFRQSMYSNISGRDIYDINTFINISINNKNN